MVEVAIVSTKCALRDEHPEFMEYYKNREWEPKPKAAPADEVEAHAECEQVQNDSAADAELKADDAELEASE